MLSAESKIEWTDRTWNFIRGCTKISPGCKFCYAETFAERFRGVPGNAYEQGFDLRLVPERLADPLGLSKPATIFVNSMSDLFHERVPEGYIRQGLEVMAATPWHTYQILTKRSERMRDLLSGPLEDYAGLSHLWFGVSVEDRRFGVPRINHLREAPVAVRFLSIEPLLEHLGPINLEGIAWAIVGGESGHRPRPMAPEWVLDLRDQCRGAEVPFFFKQWGGRNKKQAGRLLEGRTYDEMPLRESRSVPSKRERLMIQQSLGL